jgi:hypothetical protein
MPGAIPTMTNRRWCCTRGHLRWPLPHTQVTCCKPHGIGHMLATPLVELVLSQLLTCLGLNFKAHKHLCTCGQVHWLGV